MCVSFQTVKCTIQDFRAMLANKQYDDAVIKKITQEFSALIKEHALFLWDQKGSLTSQNRRTATVHVSAFISHASNQIFKSSALESLISQQNIKSTLYFSDAVVELGLEDHFKMSYGTLCPMRIRLSLYQIFQLYALSERNESICYSEQINQSNLDSWLLFNPYIDGELDRIALKENILKCDNHPKTIKQLQDYYTPEKTKKTINLFKHFLFVFIESLLHDIESLKLRSYKRKPLKVEHSEISNMHGKKYYLSNYAPEATNTESLWVAKGRKSISENVYKKHSKNFHCVSSNYQGGGVDDWFYYRFFEGTLNAGYFEDLYALSPSLGIKRSLTIGEFYNVKNFS